MVEIVNPAWVDFIICAAGF